MLLTASVAISGCAKKSDVTTAGSSAPAGATTAAKAATAGALPKAAETDKPIKFMIGDWTSLTVDTEIVTRVLNKLGYRTEMVPADDSARYAAFEAGDLHVAVETWQTTQADNLDKSLKTGKVLDMGETGLQAKEDWWFPNYMLEKCPGLPDWTALKDPKCAAAFSSADTAPKGRYLSGPVGWGGFDAERVAALDLPFVVVNSGTDAGLFSELTAAYERKAPILLWVYTPHWAPTKFEGQWIKFPKYEDACYNDPAWGVNKAAKYDCSKPEGWIKKMAWAGGEKVWPCAYSVVKAAKFDNDTIGKLTAQIDLDGKKAADVADAWLAANESTWKPWTAGCKAA